MRLSMIDAIDEWLQRAIDVDGDLFFQVVIIQTESFKNSSDI